MFWNVGRGIKQKVLLGYGGSTQIEVGWKKKGVHIQMCSFCWRVDIPIFDFGIVDQFDNTRLLQLLSAITLLIPRPPTCTQHKIHKIHKVQNTQHKYTADNAHNASQIVYCAKCTFPITQLQLRLHARLKLSLVELHEVTNNTICRSYSHQHTQCKWI